MTKNHVTRDGAMSRIASAGLAGNAADALVANLDETVLMGCVGLSADDLDAPDATLVSVVLDMSSSMSPYAAGVIDAYDTMLSALSGAKAANAILLSTWAFADAPELVSGYEPVAKKPRLSSAVYRPSGCTALYDAVLAAMTGLVTYGEELWQNGVPTRRILFVLSDGEDNQSKAKAHDVAAAARALAREEAYTLAYAGFGSTDLLAQAKAIGFDQAIAVGAKEAELRRIFRQVSASVIRVSQAAAGASAGGFF